MHDTARARALGGLALDMRNRTPDDGVLLPVGRYMYLLVTSNRTRSRRSASILSPGLFASQQIWTPSQAASHRGSENQTSARSNLLPPPSLFIYPRLSPLPPIQPTMADPQSPPAPITDEKQTIATTNDHAHHRAPSPIAPAGRMSTDSAAAADAAKKILAHSGDADEAMQAFADGEVVEVDEATNKRLLRRIDRFMMPLMCVGMCL